MLLAIVARRRTATNVALAAAAPRGVDARILTPEQAGSLIRPGGVALGRLDVVDGLDGVEDGLWALGSLAARGVRVLNRAGALLAAHDKMLTARVLTRAGLPHPRTRILHPGGLVPDWEGPLVVKPRFGSWGRDVELCEDEIAFRRHLRSLDHRLWFQRHGAVLQELVPPSGSDLRVVVAAGTAVGAISRVAAPGEWRTNIALGGTRVTVDPLGRGARARRPRRRGRERRPARRRPAARRRRWSHRLGAQRGRRLHPRIPNRSRPLRRRGRRADAGGLRNDPRRGARRARGG
jgi:hypothetical protein